MTGLVQTLVCVYIFFDLVHGLPIGTNVIVREKNPRVDRIIVNVRRKRSKYWDFWELNSNICPPSLCYSNGGGVKTRPRGTGGSIFYNGDIILDKETLRYVFGETTSRRKKRAAMRLKNRLWPKGIVYYQFSSDISKDAKRVLRKAMKHIAERTCITFQKKKNKNQDYIRFISEPGCWSNVGKVGGEQKLSLGSGCERVGTAIHELLHAIGLWHEQSRPDRDEYVEVLLDNVSPRYKDDFDVINTTLVNSRGYPYDYQSIMHYSERTFTFNGGKTIKVKGIGKTLALRIGQRDGLSNIDIAQLRDMYFCNRKKDAQETECPDGWVKEKSSCYKFVTRPKYQYSAAFKFCKGMYSTLAHINNKNEDKFLKKYLKTNFKKTKTWRIGGKRINDTFVWDQGEGRKTIEIRYKNWPSGEPSSFTSIVLAREKISHEFQWTGIWVGSLSLMPQYAYPFICERKARRKCVSGKYKDGRDYRGTLDQTVDGITCQTWTSKYPHRHNFLASGKLKDNPDGLGEHNYCRNPSQERKKRPWCFTTKQKIEWQYCDVITCSKTANKNVEKNSKETQSKYSNKKKLKT